MNQTNDVGIYPPFSVKNQVIEYLQRGGDKIKCIPGLSYQLGTEEVTDPELLKNHIQELEEIIPLLNEAHRICCDQLNLSQDDLVELTRERTDEEKYNDPEFIKTVVIKAVARLKSEGWTEDRIKTTVMSDVWDEYARYLDGLLEVLSGIKMHLGESFMDGKLKELVSGLNASMELQTSNEEVEARLSEV